MRALDIVETPNGSIGIITETNDNGTSASVNFIKTLHKNRERNAWWHENELKVIDSIPRILANAMAHPMGIGKKDVELFFKN